jgi:hypothetical protein
MKCPQHAQPPSQKAAIGVHKACSCPNIHTRSLGPLRPSRHALAMYCNGYLGSAQLNQTATSCIDTSSHNQQLAMTQPGHWQLRHSLVTERDRFVVRSTNIQGVMTHALVKQLQHPYPRCGPCAAHTEGDQPPTSRCHVQHNHMKQGGCMQPNCSTQ